MPLLPIPLEFTEQMRAEKMPDRTKLQKGEKENQQNMTLLYAVAGNFGVEKAALYMLYAIRPSRFIFRR